MNEISRLAAENLVNSLPLGLAAALFAWLASRALRNAGSAIRFAIWFTALAAIVVSPWAGALRDTSYRVVPALRSTALRLPEEVAGYLFALWLVGAVLGLAHVVLGLYRLRRLRATCQPLTSSKLDPLFQTPLASTQLQRAITVCVSDSVRVPAALGYFRPVVVFPKWALAEIPPAELNAILVHELAHLQRYDDWTNLAQKVAKALFFFHPAVWFIESRLTLEREMACDDAVLAANFSARAYAESLVGLAEKSYLRRGIQLVQAVVSHVEQLKFRLAEILRKDRPRQGMICTPKSAVAMAAVAAMLGVYGMAHAPRLIAFGSDSTSREVAAQRTPVPETKAALQPINASFHPSEHKLGTKPQVVAHAVMARGASLAVVRPTMRLVPEDPMPPVLMLTGANGDFAAMPVVLLFEGEQFGPNGPVLWRVMVIRLTPYQQEMLSGQVPKQI